jgi:hypothetical protein
MGDHLHEHDDRADAGVAASAYEAPAVDARTPACDPLIMITQSPVVC